MRQRCWSIEAELKETVQTAERMIGSCTEVLPPRLRALMRRCYGPDPEIERFGSHGQGFSDRGFFDPGTPKSPLTSEWRMVNSEL